MLVRTRSRVASGTCLRACVPSRSHLRGGVILRRALTPWMILRSPYPPREMSGTCAGVAPAWAQGYHSGVGASRAPKRNPTPPQPTDPVLLGSLPGLLRPCPGRLETSWAAPHTTPTQHFSVTCWRRTRAFGMRSGQP